MTDPVTDADRRAWHRAHAVEGPDEEVAAELERCAGRAKARGGLAATAAFLELATRLTPSTEERLQRTLDAAQAKLQIGAVESTLAMLSAAEEGPLDELQQARIKLLEAQAAFASSRGNEAPPLLLDAGRRLERLDAKLARDSYLDALSAAMFAGRLAGSTGVARVAQAARRAPRSRVPDNGELLLDALSTLFTDGYTAAVPLSKRVLQTFCADSISVEEGLRWFWLAAAIAADLWDDDGWHVLADRYVGLAREAGALSDLVLANNSLVVLEVFQGDFSAATALVDEASNVTETIASSNVPYGALWLAAWQGREQEALQRSHAAEVEAMARGEGIGLTVAQTSRAVLANGLGNYERAVHEAQLASESMQELVLSDAIGDDLAQV